MADNPVISSDHYFRIKKDNAIAKCYCFRMKKNACFIVLMCVPVYIFWHIVFTSSLMKYIFTTIEPFSSFWSLCLYLLSVFSELKNVLFLYLFTVLYVLFIKFTGEYGVSFSSLVLLWFNFSLYLLPSSRYNISSPEEVAIFWISPISPSPFIL